MKPGMYRITSATTTIVSLGPTTAIRKSARSSDGKASITSVTRRQRVLQLPPRYPAASPSATPITAAISVALRLIARSARAE